MTNFTPADVPHEYDPDEISTFVVRAKTTFSQVPRWILRAGNDLSHGAVRLYGVIMSYADNDNRSAFPSQHALMNDMGAGERSIRNYMKELETFGALIVERRRNKRTGNFYANRYVLVFDDPRTVGNIVPEATGNRVPHNYTHHLTTPTSPRSARVQPPVEPESSLRSPSHSVRGRRRGELLELVRAITRAESYDATEAAEYAFLEAFEATGEQDPGYFDYGWEKRLHDLVKAEGLDYGTAKWLGIFTNAAA